MCLVGDQSFRLEDTMHRTRSLLWTVSTLGLVACTSLPDAVRELRWQDQWGDRGAQVLARDYRMCEALVESRRSLLADCLAQRGWQLAAGG